VCRKPVNSRTTGADERSWTYPRLVAQRQHRVLVSIGVVLAIVVRSVVRGEPPSAISREGLIWPDEMSVATRAALETLQTQFELLEHDLNELADHVALSRRLP
jgi:hypothetical protein